jgi:hypothetical protein
LLSSLYSALFTDKDAGMETDGISIITESEGSDELDQPLSLAVSKEKRYLHHPNTYLNTRLNLLLAVAFAAVTGLGLGHFLGNFTRVSVILTGYMKSFSFKFMYTGIFYGFMICVYV